MKNIVIQTGPIGTNTYIVCNEIKQKAFIIDPAGSADLIEQFLKETQLELEAILLTHGHYDHILAVAELQKLGAKVYMHGEDVDKIAHQNIPGFELYGIKIQQFKPDIIVKGGDVLNICGYTIKVIHTPGHSKGSVCYVLDDMIFCGDTIFKGSYGRTDFPDGSLQDITNSVKEILSLEGEYVLYPGHGDATTASFEREHNPILL